ncbi:MAG: hypothetical protein U0270_36570 [Labilithrix sp.]
MKSLAHASPFAAALVFFACGDDDTASSIPAPADSGVTSSTSSSSGGSSGSASSSGATSSSSSGATSSSSSGAAQEKIYCDAVASRMKDCAKGDGVCSDAGKCIYGRLMSPEALNAYAACFGAPPCKSDDACFTEAGTKVGGAAATDYVSTCKAKHDACPSAYSLDYCDPGAYAYPGVGDAMTACLVKSCEDVKACFTAALGPVAACK